MPAQVPPCAARSRHWRSAPGCCSAYTLQPGLQYPGNPYYVKDGEALYNANDPKEGGGAAQGGRLQGRGAGDHDQLQLPEHVQGGADRERTAQGRRHEGEGDVFDWATAINQRRNREAWNLWFTGEGSGPSVGPFSALKEIMELVPGDPAALIAGHYASDIEIAAVREQLGLNRPFIARLGSWYVDLAHGDLGDSIHRSFPGDPDESRNCASRRTGSRRRSPGTSSTGCCRNATTFSTCIPAAVR